MAKKDAQGGLMPSILDRLIDPDSDGTSWRRGYDLEQITDAIRRDLEELLNTHPTYAQLPDEFPEVKTSLLGYGMPDLVSATISTPAQKEEIGRMVEGIIARYEPRLRSIRANLVDTAATGQAREVRFHIEAEINVDPAPSVTFETVLELMTGQAKIETTSKVT